MNTAQPYLYKCLNAIEEKYDNIIAVHTSMCTAHMFIVTIKYLTLFCKFCHRYTIKYSII